MRQEQLPLRFYRCRNWSSERLFHLLKLSHLDSDGARSLDSGGRAAGPLLSSTLHLPFMMMNDQMASQDPAWLPASSAGGRPLCMVFVLPHGSCHWGQAVHNQRWQYGGGKDWMSWSLLALDPLRFPAEVNIDQEIVERALGSRLPCSLPLALKCCHITWRRHFSEAVSWWLTLGEVFSRIQSLLTYQISFLPGSVVTLTMTTVYHFGGKLKDGQWRGGAGSDGTRICTWEGPAKETLKECYSSKYLESTKPVVQGLKTCELLRSCLLVPLLAKSRGCVQAKRDWSVRVVEGVAEGDTVFIFSWNNALVLPAKIKLSIQCWEDIPQPEMNCNMLLEACPAQTKCIHLQGSRVSGSYFSSRW